LWAALCVVRHLPLGRVLLKAGANPADGVTTHIAASHGDVATLDLLYHYGVNVNGISGGVPPLVYIMFWATDEAGPRWLLEHGADPNMSWGEEGESPVHVAARRWDVPMMELLARHGADLTRRRVDGRTPHTVAALHGNREIASWLLAHGATDEMSLLERFVATCAAGDRAGANALLTSDPSLRSELLPVHHQMLHRHAESGNAQAIETMLHCGFDPRVTDKDNVTALHRAAMAGQAGAVAVLLAHGAPVDALDSMFSATPLLWAVQGRSRPGPGTDHVAVARLLIAAGSPVEWNPPPGAPGIDATLEALTELRHAAATSG